MQSNPNDFSRIFCALKRRHNPFIALSQPSAQVPGGKQ